MKKDTIYKILIVLFAIVGIFFEAALIMLLWRWFLCPLGLIEINYWHSMGISIIVGYLELGLAKVDMGDKPDKQIVQIIAKIFIMICLLCFGAIISVLI